MCKSNRIIGASETASCVAVPRSRCNDLPIISAMLLLVYNTLAFVNYYRRSAYTRTPTRASACLCVLLFSLPVRLRSDNRRTITRCRARLCFGETDRLILIPNYATITGTFNELRAVRLTESAVVISLKTADGHGKRQKVDFSSSTDHRSHPGPRNRLFHVGFFGSLVLASRDLEASLGCLKSDR